jgi:lipoyl(octanoyl) transferase
MPEHILACRLGNVPYAPAWELQRRLQAVLIAAKRSDPPRKLPHLLLEVEHPPVFTLGKSGNPNHLLADAAGLASRGASFYHIDRGGDITFHGPGQLVGYPIFDLDRFTPDIHRYLRDLEEAVIRTCADFGIRGVRIPGRTGVWVPTDERAGERKICAMGIRCSRWVTMHGFALNVNTDLSFFSDIVPCGIPNGDVTSMARELNRDTPIDAVADRIEAHLAHLFDADLTKTEDAEAIEEVRRYLDLAPADALLEAVRPS